MDPRLVRLYEEGRADDEVAAILRLHAPGALPPGVRMVSRFGEIATVRLRRSAIPAVRAAVASMKAVRPVRSEPRHFSTNSRRNGSEMVAGDFRRPPTDLATGKGVVVASIDWGL